MLEAGDLNKAFRDCMPLFIALGDEKSDCPSSGFLPAPVSTTIMRRISRFH